MMFTVLEKLAKSKTLTPFLLVLLTGFSYPLEVSLKITGSLSYFDPDHINRNLHGREEFLMKRALSEESYTYKEGEVKDVHFATSFEGEFLLSLTSRLSIGMGTGYIYAEATEEETGITIDRTVDTMFSVHPTKINAFPLNLCGYYFLPLSNSLKLYVRGGLGLIWAKYIERVGIWLKPKDNYIEILHQKATARGLSYFSGIGLIYEAYPDIHFFIEAEAKLAKLSKFQGEEQQGERMTLYSYEQYDSELEFWQGKNILQKEKPSGDDLRAVEEAVVDLSGFSVKLGITIKF
jgi:hypothetical protein